jgi:fibronectin-binding autotransporter adhesin
MKTLARLTCAGLLAGSVIAASAQSSPFWVGTGTSLNWSDTFNWSTAAVPGAADFAYFEDLNTTTGWTNSPGLVNNIVDSSLSVGTLYYTATATGVAGGPASHFYTTLVPGGVTLTLGGQSGFKPAALAVGDVPGSGAWLNLSGPTNYTTITGAGTLTPADPASVLAVGMRNRATLDLSGLNTFLANLQQVWVAVSTDNPYNSGTTGWLLLARTNTISTPASLAAPGVLLGFQTNATGTATVQLGEVNQINTDALVVGGRRGSATLQFAAPYRNSATPGSLKLRGSASGSTPVSTFSLGDSSASPSGYNLAFLGNSASATGTADFSGASVDIRADSIYIGRASSATQAATGTGNGTLIVEQGTVSATNVFIAYKPPGSTNASIGQGALILRSNAVMNVAQEVALVYRTNGTSFISESRIAVSNSAVLNIGGNLVTTHTIGSWTPASVTLGGGTINLTGGGIVSVPTLTGFGTVSGASSITVTNTFSIGASGSAATLNLGNNLTLGSAIRPIFDLGADTTVGGGVNDYLSVVNNLNFNNNPITLTFSAPLVTGTYKLVGYGGAQSGSVTWVNPTRMPIGLEQGSGQVAIVVTNATPGTLVWQASGTSANWSTTNLVWNGNTEKFYQLDHVLFDDTGVATTVTIAAITNVPSSVTFDNSAKDYSLAQSGNGALGGFTALIKNGTGVLSMGAGGANNYFTGPVNLNAGTIRVASFNTGVFGTTGSTTPINIASGATLDVYGNSIGSGGSYGRPINVGGTGVGGNGAIVHANPTGSANPTVSTPQVTLTSDTLIGAVATKALNVSGLNTPYSGVLDLAGYTLTTTGGGETRLVQMVTTNGGNLTIGSGILAIRNSIIEGAGTLNIGNNILSLGGNNAFTTGYLAKAISVGTGSLIAPNANAFTVPVSSPISLASGGALSITNSQAIALSGMISGGGALNKFGPSNLVLAAANTYSGPTLVGAGRLVIAPGGSLASPSITVASGAGFDATQLPGGYIVPAGQNLSLAGTAYGNLAAAANGTISGSGSTLGSVSVAPSGTLACGTAVVPGTLTIGSNLTFTGGTALFKLGSVSTPGGGVNDLVVVNGDLDVSGPTTLKIDPVATLSGVYTLIQYSGAFSGATNLTVTSDSRYLLELNLSTPGLVQLTVKGGAGDLAWKGGQPANPTAWNIHGTQNWLKSGSPDYFYNGDTVTFDDTAVTNRVSLFGQLKPAAINFNNSSAPYRLEGAGNLLAGSLTTLGAGGVTLANSADNTFVGAGLAINAGSVTLNQPVNATLTSKLAGFAPLEKDGTNVLTLVSADSSQFFGSVNMNAGRLRVGTPDALGVIAANVASGATLDLNGKSLPSPSIRVSGAGNDGRGAVNNTGATLTNAVRSLELAGATTLGADAGRWGIASTDITPAYVQGNNNTLTKVGPADIWISTGSETSLGDIDIAEGRLVFSGAGTTLGNPFAALNVRSNAALGLAGGILPGTAKQAVIEPGGSVYVSGNNQFDGPMLLNGGLFSLQPNATLILGDKLSGPGMLNLRGVAAGNFGTLTLLGTNSYTGGTLVNDGMLVIADNAALPDNTNVVLVSRVPYNQGGHPILQLASNVVSSPNVLLDMQTVGAAGAAQAGLSGDAATWSGPIRMSGGIAQCTANFSSGLGGLIVAGAVDGTNFSGNVNGNGGVKVAGDGVLVSDVTLGGTGVRFNQPLRFNGSFSCNNAGLGGAPGMTKLVLASGGNSWVDMYWVRGVIQLAADEALPLVPINIGTLVSGADHRVILDLNGHTQTLVAWNERFTGNDPAWFGNSSTNADATLIYAGSGTNAWTTYILDAFDTNSPVQRQTALSVSAGYLKLVPYPFGEPTPGSGIFPSGPPPYPFGMTYTGPTTITGGSLEVTKYLGMSPVTVSGTGYLRGVGPLGGTLMAISGGTVAPGTNLIGSLAISNKVTLGAGGNGLFRLNPTTLANDKLTAITDLTLNGCTLVLTNVSAGAYAAGQSFKLFDAATYTVGAVSILPVVPGPGLGWDTTDLGVNGTVKVVTQPAAAPAVSGVSHLGDGNVGFTLTGTPGQAFTVRASTAVTDPLAAWTVLQTATLPTASYLFTDLTATNYPRRFYQVSTP